MKTSLLLISLLGTSLIGAAEKTDDAQMQIKQEGIQYIKMLGGTLKSQLQTHMQADKTGLSAIGFCSARAEEITKEVNEKLPEHASVRRTALHIRNVKNKPDPLDIEVMKAYEKSIADNTFQPNNIKMIKDVDTTRIYKPLVTQGVCLKCHGSNINKDIQEIITAHYPKDEAMGFKEGSLRGVIVAEIKK
ncbi:MAG TPA: DUF3365 domain-containing protein [Sulfurovum sp.]